MPQPRDNAWAREHGLVDRFVVMHSGNVGHAQNLDALVRAATFLRDLDDLTIAIVGDGARHADLVELAELLEVGSTSSVSRPYQPRELLPQSLSSADVHVVGLARGLSGYVVPSRLYGILAAGRPVIVAADPESETAQLVRAGRLRRRRSARAPRAAGRGDPRGARRRARPRRDGRAADASTSP